MPAKVDRCVEEMLARKTFKPKAEEDERKSAAWAICQSAVSNSAVPDYVIEMLSELPPDIDVAVNENGLIELSEVEGYKFDDELDELDEDHRINIYSTEKQEEHLTYCALAEVNLANTTKSKIVDENGEENETSLIELEVLREGDFEHPWYGPLKFDKKYFMSVIQNFANNAVEREVSFDSSHKPVEGATAWVKKLGIKRRMFRNRKIKNVLTASIEPTAWGKELLEGKRFKYFSIEVDHNYVHPEDGTEYGPTMRGGGLTNRPFIPGMNAVAMSEDVIGVTDGMVTSTEPGTNGSISLDGVTSDTNTSQAFVQSEVEQQTGGIEAGQEDTQITNTKLPNELDTVTTAQVESEEKRPPDSELPNAAKVVKASTDNEVKDMDELAKQIAALEERLASLDTADTELGKTLSEQLDFLKAQDEKFQAKLEEAQTAAEQKFSEKFEKQEAILKTLEGNLAMLEDERNNSAINARCDAMIKQGHYPATVNVVREMALSLDRNTDFTVKLSEDGAEKSFDFMSAMEKVFESIPEDGRVDDSASLSHDTTPPKNQADDKGPGVISLGDKEIDLFSDEYIDGIIKKTNNLKPAN